LQGSAVTGVQRANHSLVGDRVQKTSHRDARIVRPNVEPTLYWRRETLVFTAVSRRFSCPT